jgi:hypothetical protein
MIITSKRLQQLLQQLWVHLEEDVAGEVHQEACHSSPICDQQAAVLGIQQQLWTH